MEPSHDRSQPTLWDSHDAETVKLPTRVRERSRRPAQETKTLHPPKADDLWDKVFSRSNLARALQRVEANGGAPGTDGMAANELRAFLASNWDGIKASLDDGTYRPHPVRRVSIPKPDGGTRELGVPTVVDRFIQQVLLHVLTAVFDPNFSETSFGFRPKRSAHMAVQAARGYIQEGHHFVVDIDLDSFFDRVNHDMLMARVARKVADKKVLKLIRAYLNAGVMVGGVKVGSAQGTPQGGPLSPLLANIMLDDLDRELERRGHRFVRYADDIRIYVASERAAERVLDGVAGFIERRLKLKVNRAKSGTAPANKRGLLGFGFFWRKGKVKVRVDDKAKRAVKMRIRQLTSRTWGVSMQHRIEALNRFISGWCAYFALAETPSVFERLDGWLRRRLRQVQWKQWGRHVATKRRALRALGIPPREAALWACTPKGSWRIAGSAPLQRALPDAHWKRLGLLGFTGSYRHMQEVWRTA